MASIFGSAPAIAHLSVAASSCCFINQSKVDDFRDSILQQNVLQLSIEVSDSNLVQIFKAIQNPFRYLLPVSNLDRSILENLPEIVSSLLHDGNPSDAIFFLRIVLEENLDVDVISNYVFVKRHFISVCRLVSIFGSSEILNEELR